MDDRTARALNAINRRFYRDNAAGFDATRREPWPGWTRVLSHVDTAAELRVLDVGCGNGRFAAFLADHCRTARVRYTGIDACGELLARARARGLPFADAAWLEADVVERAAAAPLDRGAPYALIALFGVLHHVPGLARRIALLRALGSLLAPDGVLALASWRFAAFERFRDKIVPWDVYNRSAVEPIDVRQLEAGDHLLPWSHRPDAHRYCHFASESELRDVLREARLEPIDVYRSDGRGDALNRYAICRFSNAQVAPNRSGTVR